MVTETQAYVNAYRHFASASADYVELIVGNQSKALYSNGLAAAACGIWAAERAFRFYLGDDTDPSFPMFLSAGFAMIAYQKYILKSIYDHLVRRKRGIEMSEGDADQISSYVDTARLAYQGSLACSTMAIAAITYPSILTPILLGCYFLTNKDNETILHRAAADVAAGRPLVFNMESNKLD